MLTSPDRGFTLPALTPYRSPEMWIPRLNAVLGSFVVTLGFWLIWEEIPPVLAVVSALLMAGFLIWRGTTIPAIWAWVTLLLGLESLTWPVVTMVRVRTTATEPTEQEMGLILTALLFGLFSAIFWLTFSFGIYRRFIRKETGAVETTGKQDLIQGTRSEKKVKR